MALKDTINDLQQKIIDKFPGLNLSDPKNKKTLALLFLALALGIAIIFVKVYKTAKTEGSDAYLERGVTIDTPDAVDNDILGVENQIDAFEITDDGKGGGITTSAAGAMAAALYEQLATLNMPAVTADTAKAGQDDSGKPGMRDQAMSAFQTPVKVQVQPETPVETVSSEVEKMKAEAEQELVQINNSKKQLAEEKARSERLRRQQLISMGYNPDTGKPLTDAEKAAYGIQPSTAGSVSPASSLTSSLSNAVGQATATDGTAQTAAAEEPKAPVANIRKTGSVSTLDDEWNSVGGVSSLDTHDEYVNQENHPFEVMFIKNEKLSSGGRVSLRILEDMMVEGVRIPANTLMSAICSVGGNRLEVTVKALRVNDKIYTLNLVGYDTDGLQGLYCAETNLGRSAEQAKTEAGNIVRSVLQTGIAGYAGRVVSSGATILQNAAGNVTISVTAGYKFYLMRNEQ